MPLLIGIKQPYPSICTPLCLHLFVNCVGSLTSYGRTPHVHHTILVLSSIVVFLEVSYAYGGHQKTNFQFSKAERYFGSCGEPCHSSNSAACQRSMPPQRHQHLDLEYYGLHNRPRPGFFLVLLNIEHGGKASCFTPLRNLLRTPATYKGNGTAYESTLSARPHKQRRCCFDTCSNSHHTPLWIFASMLVRPRVTLGLTWPHTLYV